MAIAKNGDAPRHQNGDAQDRPPLRRFNEESRTRATRSKKAAPNLGPEAAPFVALAATQFRLTGQAADTMVENLTNELESLMSQMSSHTDQDIKRAKHARSIGEALIKQAQAVSNRCHGALHWLERTGVAADNDPSEGVALIARQMAMAGAPESEIETLLDKLGVGDPEAAVARALRDSGR